MIPQIEVRTFLSLIRFKRRHRHRAFSSPFHAPDYKVISNIKIKCMKITYLCFSTPSALQIELKSIQNVSKDVPSKSKTDLVSHLRLRDLRVSKISMIGMRTGTYGL